jgi:hypothetical protein
MHFGTAASPPRLSFTSGGRYRTQQRKEPDMKKILIAAGFATLLAGTALTTTALTTSPAQASWAESAQGNPVYTGTNRSLRRSERGRRHFAHRAGRGYMWHPGYSAYGRYNGGDYSYR